MADQEKLRFAAPVQLGVDLGYVGFKAEGAVVMLPNKRPKGGELTEEQRLENHLFSSYRVGIEHVNSSIKRSRAVKEPMRLRTTGASNLVMLLACGLHNFRLRHRPQPPLALSYPHASTS